MRKFPIGKVNNNQNLRSLKLHFLTHGHVFSSMLLVFEGAGFNNFRKRFWMGVPDRNPDKVHDRVLLSTKQDSCNFPDMVRKKNNNENLAKQVAKVISDDIQQVWNQILINFSKKGRGFKRFQIEIVNI